MVAAYPPGVLNTTQVEPNTGIEPVSPEYGTGASPQCLFGVWRKRWVPTPLTTFLRPNGLANRPLCQHWVRFRVMVSIRAVQAPFHLVSLYVVDHFTIKQPAQLSWTRPLLAGSVEY